MLPTSVRRQSKILIDTTKEPIQDLGHDQMQDAVLPDKSTHALLVLSSRSFADLEGNASYGRSECARLLLFA